MEHLTSIQWITFIVAIVVILIRIKRCLRYGKWLIAIPTITLMMHFVLFFSLKNLLSPLDVNSWSSIIRLQASLTFLILELYGYGRDKQWIQPVS
jgi:hypothetical protein